MPEVAAGAVRLHYVNRSGAGLYLGRRLGELEMPALELPAELAAVIDDFMAVAG
ncbi:MAG: hypothetical protein M3R49_11430 [Chloroflexota bacterium]|nr:hypothetical protein [Chloroflexota bacterium]